MEVFHRAIAYHHIQSTLPRSG